MAISEQALVLLKNIAAEYPNPLTVAPGHDELMELREGDFVDQWDMHPNGDRRWIVTPTGRALVERCT